MRKLSLIIALGTMVTFLAGADGGCGGGGSTSDPDTGGNTGPDGGVVANYPKTCTGDSDCLATEVCHPIGLVCVKNCLNDATVCGQDSCVETTFGGKTVSVCKCDVCAAGGEVCSKDLDDVCETKCTANADCNAFIGQTRTCDTATGLCKFQAPGACDPACTNGQVCDANGVCIDPCPTAKACNLAVEPKCNTTTKLCEPCAQDSDCASVPNGTYKCDKTGTTPTCVSTATTCNSTVLAPGANKGPDTCNYGDVCATGTNVCTATLPDGTCATGYTWNKALQGPVVFSVTGYSFQGSSTPCSGATDKDCCAPATGVTGRGGGMAVDIEFYAPNKIAGGTWTEKSGQIKFIDTTGAVMSSGHFADFPTANATYSIKPLHAGVCTKNGGTAQIVTDGWSVYLVDSTGAGGNAACL
ncbi:MAG TPA: hypothetical protein VGK67_10385 [Myxococcales bacterium]|jgi:hypothetical protein